MGLIDEILHYVIGLYRNEKNLRVMQQALDRLYEEFSTSEVNRTLHEFGDEFPAVAVYRQEIDLEAFMEAEAEGVPHRQMVLEEMLMLWLANMNPAFSPFFELFDDSTLEKGYSLSANHCRFEDIL